MKCSKCWIWWHKNWVNSDFRSTLIFYIPERNKYPVGLVTHESPLLRARQLILCLLLFDHKVLSDLCRDDPVVRVQDQDYFPGWRNHVWISFEVVQSRERRRTSCDIPPPPPCVFWLSHWLWKPYLSGIFNLWVLPTLSKLLRWAISDRPGSFTDVYEKDYKFVKEFSEGEIYVVYCKSSALFHVKWLYAFLYVQRQEFGYSLWGQKVSLLMSFCFEGLSDLQAVVTPTIDGLNGKQVCVCVCACVGVKPSLVPLHPWETRVNSDRWLTLLNCISKWVENLFYSLVKHSLLLH